MIDVFGKLREVGQSRTGGTKWGIEITSVPDLVFNDGDKGEAAVAQKYALAIAATLKANLTTGRQPDGSPMPQVSPATVERRERHVAQAARGGKRDPRYRSNTPQRAARARIASRNWRRQFTASKLGKFTPKGGSTWGMESGMLAASPAVAHEGGGVFRVFFADARGLLLTRGKTAVQRVFARIDVWNQRAMAQPRIADAGRAALKSLITTRAGALASSALGLVLEVAELAETVAEPIDG